MTPEEHKALRDRHAACPPSARAWPVQRAAGRLADGRCHMAGEQCQHIREFNCLSCGYGWAEEAKA